MLLVCVRLVVVNQERLNKYLVGISEPLGARNALDLLAIEANSMRSGIIIFLVLAEVRVQHLRVMRFVGIFMLTMLALAFLVFSE